MSIPNINLYEYKQNFNVSKDNKHKYGEVNTDFKLIYKMFKLLPEELFSNPELKWLDPCCGCGYFTMVLYKKLFMSLDKIDKQKRTKHILEKMLFMNEINKNHLEKLQTLFGEKNVSIGDFLKTKKKYDVIIGNPPYNINGKIKVPTNNINDKKQDGKSIWMEFVKHALKNLNENGYLLFIIPSIWMKRDHPLHNLLTSYDIKIYTMNNTETNKWFHKQAQTPTSIISLKKVTIKKTPSVMLYDRCVSKYVDYSDLRMGSLPVFGANILKKVMKGGDIKLKVIKTNMPSKKISLSTFISPERKKKNIKSCVMKKRKKLLVLEYSDKDCVFSGVSKIVMAHKMYGFPYYDKKGEYGISNRDNYVIIDKKDREFKVLERFLSSKLMLYLFECTRYRMKYLEKYIFEMIPDVTQLKDFPSECKKKDLYDYFDLSLQERKIIDGFLKKDYENYLFET